MGLGAVIENQLVLPVFNVKWYWQLGIIAMNIFLHRLQESTSSIFEAMPYYKRCGAKCQKIKT
jgi:hypothetical protein